MYDGPVKRDLLNYAFAMLHLSIRGVDSNIVGCNRSFESPANYPQQLYLTEWFSSTGLPALERRACAEPSLRNLLSGIFTRERLFMPRHDAIASSAPCCRCHSTFPRLGDFFTSGQLVEINSHSLFSKWFSESGKLVQKMFTEIKRLVENSGY